MVTPPPKTEKRKRVGEEVNPVQLQSTKNESVLQEELRRGSAGDTPPHPARNGGHGGGDSARNGGHGGGGSPPPAPPDAPASRGGANAQQDAAAVAAQVRSEFLVEDIDLDIDKFFGDNSQDDGDEIEKSKIEKKESSPGKKSRRGRKSSGGSSSSPPTPQVLKEN